MLKAIRIIAIIILLLMLAQVIHFRIRLYLTKRRNDKDRERVDSFKETCSDCWDKTYAFMASPYNEEENLCEDCYIEALNRYRDEQTIESLDPHVYKL